MGDVDGISDFNQSDSGQFITYLTDSRHHKKLKVFDRYNGSVVNLASSDDQTESVMLGMGGVKNYNLMGAECVGYQVSGNKFIVQEVSTSGKNILFEIGPVGLGNPYFFISKDQKTLVSAPNASGIDFHNLDTGETQSSEVDFSSEGRVDSPNGSLGLVYSTDKFALLNKDTKEVSETQLRSDTGESWDRIYTGAFIENEKSLVLSEGKNLVFYSIDDDYTCKKEKHLEIGFAAQKISESIDENHLICSNKMSYYVIDKKLGHIVNKIDDTKAIKEHPKGQMLILNNDVIDFCDPVESIIDDSKQSPQTIFINGENANFDEDQYSHFEHSSGEMAEGSFWNFYKNSASDFLEKKEEFTWGKERLYLELPIEELESIKDLIIEIVSQENIPIQFKLIDAEKTDPSIGIDKTRFVLNFKNVEDAKKLHKELSENEVYKNVLPDRNDVDYFAYNIDDKAFYASGYREERELQQKELDSIKNNHTRDNNGTYTIKNGTDDLGTDILETISEEEYVQKLNDINPVVSSKVKWES